MELGWKQSFKLQRDVRSVLGLDIGLSSIKAVSLQKENGGYAVTACGLAQIPTNGDDGNRRKRRVNIVRTIRECLDMSGAKAGLAVCGVSGPEVVVRDFGFPAMPQEEIDGPVQLEASQACPFNTEDTTVDYQVISKSDDNIRGILVAATNALIKSKVYLANEAALSCVIVDVDGLALLNCFRQLETHVPGQATAILNIGGSYTNLAIVSDDGWPFVRDMISVGDDIVRKMAAEKDLPPATIRQILSGNAEIDQSDYIESLERASKKLVADVVETLRYYDTQKKAEPLEKMFVCGDLALADGFIDVLNRQLAVETVLWNPFQKMRCDTGRDHKAMLQKNMLHKTGPAMAVAAGLAMRMI